MIFSMDVRFVSWLESIIFFTKIQHLFCHTVFIHAQQVRDCYQDPLIIPVGGRQYPIFGKKYPLFIDLLCATAGQRSLQPCLSRAKLCHSLMWLSRLTLLFSRPSYPKISYHIVTSKIFLAYAYYYILSTKLANILHVGIVD